MWPKNCKTDLATRLIQTCFFRGWFVVSCFYQSFFQFIFFMSIFWSPSFDLWSLRGVGICEATMLRVDQISQFFPKNGTIIYYNVWYNKLVTAVKSKPTFKKTFITIQYSKRFHIVESILNKILTYWNNVVNEVLNSVYPENAITSQTSMKMLF